MFEKLEEIRRKYEEVRARLADPAFVQDHRAVRDAQKTLSEFEPIIAKNEDHRRLSRELEGARELVESLSPGDELHAMAATERAELTARLEAIEADLKVLLVPRDPNDSRNVFLEIRAGTGGEEAALFAAQLFRMYQRYAEARRWKVEIVDRDDTGIGGLKAITALIEGDAAYSRLKYESGVHRVQRVPETESSGRIHTSAATVAVLPEAEDVDVQIDDKDLRIDVYRSSGPGGQSVNTTDSAVRITHLPTGLVVIQQDEKSQHKNKAKALKVLRTRLFELERERLASERAGARKSMVGSGDRSERIRTYNYPQGRVTDHRINLTLHKLEQILEGPGLSELVDALVAEDEAERLAGLEDA